MILGSLTRVARFSSEKCAVLHVFPPKNVGWAFGKAGAALIVIYIAQKWGCCDNQSGAL